MASTILEIGSGRALSVTSKATILALSLRNCAGLCRVRRDPNRASREILFHQSDDWRVGDRPHSLDVLDSFDAQTTRSAVECRQSKCCYDLGAIEWPACNWLTRNNQDST